MACSSTHKPIHSRNLRDKSFLESYRSCPGALLTTHSKRSEIGSDRLRRRIRLSLWTDLAKRPEKRAARPPRRNQSSTATTDVPGDGVPRVVDVAEGLRVHLQPRRRTRMAPDGHHGGICSMWCMDLCRARHFEPALSEAWLGVQAAGALPFFMEKRALASTGQAL